MIIGKRTFEFKNWTALALLALLYLLILFYCNKFIVTRSLFYNSLDTQLSYSRIDQLFSIRRRWEWTGIAIIPFLLLTRVSFVSACISISCYLSNLRISYKNIFHIAIVAEICLAAGMLIKIIWLTFIPVNTLKDVQYFSPLSLAQLLGPTSIPKYLLYLCQTINIFEIAYWLVLAAGLVAFLGKPFGKMFKLVMSSYGLGLLLWIVFVSYLTVTFSA